MDFRQSTHFENRLQSTLDKVYKQLAEGDKARIEAEARAAAANASAELNLRENWRLERDRLLAEQQGQRERLEAEVK